MINTRDIAAPAAELSIRSKGGENHHIWNNNGTWWVHFTIHLPDYTARRVRRSLRTRDVAVARARRDELLKSFPAAR